MAAQEQIAGDKECSVDAIPSTLASINAIPSTLALAGDEASFIKHTKVVIEDEDEIVNTVDSITCIVETKLCRPL